MQTRARKVPLFQQGYLLDIVIKQNGVLLLYHLTERNHLSVHVVILLELWTSHEFAEHVEGERFVITGNQCDQGAHDDVTFGSFNSLGQE